MSLPQEDNGIDYHTLRGQVMSEYQAGRVQRALDLLDRHKAAGAGHESVFGQWRACFLALLGRSDEAVGTLQAAVDQGCWWSTDILTGDPDLASLQNRPDFQALVAACEERRRVAQKSAKPERIVLEPAGAGPDQLRPLILAMHGRNGNLHDNEEHWATATCLGWQVVLIGSSQVVGSNGYGWDDRDLALKELRQHLDEVCRDYPIDRSRIVLAGFSQSGLLAAILALTDALPVSGCFSAAPAADQPEDLDRLLAGRRPAECRYVVIGGALDLPWVEMAYRLIAFYQQNNIDHRAKIYPNIGHEFPAEFADRLPEWLDFLTAAKNQ